MALPIDHQAISVPAGTREFGPVTIPDGLTRITLRMARRTTATPTLWAAAVVVQLQSWVWSPREEQWIQWLGFGPAPGGILIKRDSTETTETWVSSPLPDGEARVVKFKATVSGGTLVSELTVEVV